jgi:hypothetical protein
MGINKRKKVRVNLNLYADQMDRLRRLVELDDVDMSARVRKWLDEKLADVYIEEIIEKEGSGSFDII